MSNPGKKQGDHLQRSNLLSFRIGSRTHKVDYRQAFVYGHTLLRGGHPQRALQVFQALSNALPSDRRAKMMLARCQAGLSRYEACKEILESVFDRADCPEIEELQAAFVYKQLGMLDAAAKELVKFVAKHKELPTAYLSLGDLLASSGRTDEAAACWKLAIKRDSPGGPVAKAALRQLRQLKKAAPDSAHVPPQGNVP